MGPELVLLTMVGQEDKHRFEKQQTKTIQATFGYSSVKAVIFFFNYSHVYIHFLAETESNKLYTYC